MVKKTKKKPHDRRDNGPRLGKHLINGGPGRPHGSKNKFTLLKERIIDTIEKLDERCGGEEKDWLVELAKGSQTNFVKLITAALPKNLEIDAGVRFSDKQLHDALATLKKMNFEPANGLMKLHETEDDSNSSGDGGRDDEPDDS